MKGLLEMGFNNIGYLYEKTTKKGNRVLMGKLTLNSVETRVMVNLKRGKGGSLSVAELIDEEEAGAEKKKTAEGKEGVEEKGASSEKKVASKGKDDAEPRNDSDEVLF